MRGFGTAFFAGTEIGINIIIRYHGARVEARSAVLRGVMYCLYIVLY